MRIMNKAYFNYLRSTIQLRMLSTYHRRGLYVHPVYSPWMPYRIYRIYYVRTTVITKSVTVCDARVKRVRGVGLDTVHSTQ